jgi:hypothetical protein
MLRREFIAGLGAAAWPLTAPAQQYGGVRRIGVLMDRIATSTLRQSYLAAFIQELRQLGWTEGQNLRVDVRWSAGDASLARTYAAQLIGLMPDVLIASTTINLTVIREATSTVPVVFVSVSDPVEQDFVTSMRRPGGKYRLGAGGRRAACYGHADPPLSGLLLDARRHLIARNVTDHDVHDAPTEHIAEMTGEHFP